MTTKEIIEQIASDSKDYWKTKIALLELEHQARMEMLNELTSKYDLHDKN